MTKFHARTTVREYPNNRFLDANQEFDRLMDQLRTLREAHFGVRADCERNWGEVASVNFVNGLLKQALEHYGIQE